MSQEINLDENLPQDPNQVHIKPLVGYVPETDKYYYVKIDPNGNFYTSPGIPGSSGYVNDVETSAQTDKELIAAPAAGLSIYIDDIIISNGATAGTIKIEEDTGSAKTAIIGPLNFGINGGCVINFKNPRKLTAAKNLGLTSVACTTHTISIVYHVGD